MTTREYNKTVGEQGHRLFLMIVKNLRDEDEAKNIVQDSFEILWKNRAEISTDKAKSFLFTTGYRKMIDLIRREKRFNQYLSELNIGNTESIHSKLNAKALLETAFSQVKSKYRQVIVLRDQEGYSYQEIAEITGLSPAQVRTNLFRGRAKMREIITQLEEHRIR